MLKIAIFLQTPHRGPGTFPTAKKWKKQEFPTCVQNNGGDCAHSSHSFASGGPISFSSERNGGKNAAKNPWFLDFLPPLAGVF